jgi:tetratricopeptide (TPR) repeat protein
MVRRPFSTVVICGILVGFTILSGCRETTGELTAEELTEIEKETLDALAEELEDIERAQRETEEEFYEQVAEYNEKIRERRHETIEQYKMIIEEAEELDNISPYLEEVYYNLGDLYYEEAKDLYEDDAYRERMIRVHGPDPTAADPEAASDGDIVIRTFKASMKAYQDLANYYIQVEERNRSLPPDAMRQPTKYFDDSYYNMGVVADELAIRDFTAFDLHRNDSLENFLHLLENFPESDYAAEVKQRVGRIYFERNDFDNAIKYFSQVQPGEFQYYKALYLKAWSHFLNTQYEEAVTDFFRVLDLFDEMSAESEEGAKIAEIHYEECAEYCAQCFLPSIIDLNTQREQMSFTEIGIDWQFGPEPFKRFLVNNNLLDIKYTPDIIRRAIYNYSEYGWYAQAINLARFYVETYPESPDAPKVFYDIVKFYGSWAETLIVKDREDPAQLAWLEQETKRLEALQNQVRDEFIARYAVGSAWYLANQDNPEALANARAALARSLYDVAIYTYIVALDAEEAEDEKTAQEFYPRVISYLEQYLRDYPLEEDAYKANFYLAMSYYSVGDYMKAGDNFMLTAGTSTVDLYPGKTEHKEESLWYAAAAYKFGSDEFETARWEEKINQPHVDLTLEQQREKTPSKNPRDVLPDVCKKFVWASREYGRIFKEGNPEAEHDLEKLYYWEGNLMMAYDCFDSGRDALERIVDLDFVPAYDPDTAKMSRAQIAFRIGESWYDQHYYWRAAEWYRKAATLADTGSELEEMALNNASAAEITAVDLGVPRVEIAEGEEEAELPPEIRTQLEESARSYMRVARENLYNPDIAVKAFNNAGFIYAAQLKDYEQAIVAYHELSQNFPDHPDVDKALYSEALAYFELEEWYQAAGVFEQVLENAITPTEQEPAALFKAGECYEKLKNWPNAQRIFTRYGQTYRETGVPDQVVDSFYRAGHASLKLGDEETGRELLFECTKVYEEFNVRPGVEVNFDIPAKAYVEIGDLLFDEYAVISLEGDLMDLDPLVQVATQKYGMMNELAEIYGRASKAADLEVNLSARYKAGLVYEQFYLTVNRMKISFATLDKLMEENPDYALEIEEIVMEQLAEFQATMDAWAAENGLDRAIQVYEFIIRTAEERGESNQWVLKAKERLVDLVPQAYMHYPPMGLKVGMDDLGASIWDYRDVRFYSQTVDIEALAPEPEIIEEPPIEEGVEGLEEGVEGVEGLEEGAEGVESLEGLEEGETPESIEEAVREGSVEEGAEEGYGETPVETEAEIETGPEPEPVDETTAEIDTAEVEETEPIEEGVDTEADTEDVETEPVEEGAEGADAEPIE